MDLSIVIPCYNMEKYLSICLDSVLNQDIPTSKYEILVINDGSTDNSLQIAESYHEKHPNIKIIDQINCGLGTVRNKGIDAATGKYIYFLDSDDFIAQNFLGRLLSIMNVHTLDILTFGSKSVTAEDQSIQTPTFDITEIPDCKDGVAYLANDKYKNEVWWYIIKKEFLESSGVRFIVGRWMEDSLFTAQLFSKAKKMAYLPIIGHGYRKIPTSAMQNKKPEHYNKLIDDLAHAAISFEDIIGKVPNDNPNTTKCKARLKTRQQSLTFFLMVRYMKSNLPLRLLPERLNKLKKVGAYPFKNFIGSDYHGISFSVLTFIYNHKLLYFPFIKLFRLFYPIPK